MTYLCNVERNKKPPEDKKGKKNKEQKIIITIKKITIMKKSVFFLAALVCMMMQSVSTFASDRIIPKEQLPAAAQTFIQKTFPGQTVSYAKIDFDGRKTYEVRLSNGTEVEFDKNGTWDKVDCNHSAVPANLVPANIATYVKSNFPGATIVKIDKERYGYDIELSNDLELKFNKNGKMLRVDD